MASRSWGVAFSGLRVGRKDLFGGDPGEGVPGSVAERAGVARVETMCLSLRGRSVRSRRTGCGRSVTLDTVTNLTTGSAVSLPRQRGSRGCLIAFLIVFALIVLVMIGSFVAFLATSP